MPDHENNPVVALAVRYLQTAVAEDPPRANAFRVLGLHVYATPEEIWKREMLLGRPQQGGSGGDLAGPLPLPRPPTAHEVAEALRRLRSPATRLIDELFWFWPDQALPGLSNHPDQVLQRWSKQASQNDWQATHSLAVFYLARALDYEAQDVTGPVLTQRQVDACVACWPRALRHWQSLRQCDALWGQFESRVRHLKDARFKPDLLPVIRRSLEEILLRGLLALAVRARQSERIISFHRLQELVEKASPEPALRLRVTRTMLSQLAEGMKLVLESMRGHVAQAPGEGFPHVTELLSAAEPTFDLFDRLLPASDVLATTYSDDVTEAVLGAVIDCTNATRDSARGLRLLMAIQPRARGRRVRERLEHNIKTARGNLNQDLP
jgi:hypothetical protein